MVGYTGGTYKNPSYPIVCSGMSGHAEAVQVEYDPKVVSYEQLLDAFWKVHNPSAPVFFKGGQYRSSIFYHSAEQAAVARKAAGELKTRTKRDVNTEIVPATTFFKAEDYHQNYYKKQGVGVCKF